MRGAKTQCLLKISLEFIHALTGQGIHQVDVVGVKSTSRLLDRSERLIGIMHPAQGAQFVVIEALYTHRQSVHTRLPVSLETLPLKGARVGFERDLRINRQR